MTQKYKCKTCGGIYWAKGWEFHEQQALNGRSKTCSKPIKVPFTSKVEIEEPKKNEPYKFEVSIEKYRCKGCRGVYTKRGFEKHVIQVSRGYGKCPKPEIDHTFRKETFK